MARLHDTLLLAVRPTEPVTLVGGGFKDHRVVVGGRANCGVGNDPEVHARVAAGELLLGQHQRHLRICGVHVADMDVSVVLRLLPKDGKYLRGVSLRLTEQFPERRHLQAGSLVNSYIMVE